MALNPLKICWLEYLYTKSAFDNKKKILDLGPQDLTTKRDYIESVVSYRFEKEELETILSNIFDEHGKVKDGFWPHFYSLWGFSEYFSLDYNDARANYKYDLNKLHDFPQQFDVITNFGTAEHIFNIGTFYENLHNLLSINGIALSITPTYADINHGFYNIHPNVYSQLMRTNRYKQHSFVYLDNYVGKNALLSKSLQIYDFENPEIRLGSIDNNFDDMSKLSTFREKVYRLFKRNILDNNSLEHFHNPERGCFDYLFVAYEKLFDEEFEIPQQYTPEAVLLSN